MRDGGRAFLSLCSCVILFVFWGFFCIVLLELIRENVLFKNFLLVVLSVELYDQILEVCFVFTHSFPFFLSFYSMHQ